MRRASQEAPEQTDPSSSKEPSEKKGISLPDGLIAGAGAAVLASDCGLRDLRCGSAKKREGTSGTDEGKAQKASGGNGLQQDEFERLLNERKAALGKRTANDEPEDLL